MSLLTSPTPVTSSKWRLVTSSPLDKVRRGIKKEGLLVTNELSPQIKGYEGEELGVGVSVNNRFSETKREENSVFPPFQVGSSWIEMSLSTFGVGGWWLYLSWPCESASTLYNFVLSLRRFSGNPSEYGVPLKRKTTVIKPTHRIKVIRQLGNLVVVSIFFHLCCWRK